MSDEVPTVPFDAAIVPVGWDPAPGTGPATERAFRIARYLKPLFGGRQPWIHAMNPVFISAGESSVVPPGHTLLFGTGHALEGRPRYTWEDGQLPGLRLGRLIPEAKTAP